MDHVFIYTGEMGKDSSNPSITGVATSLSRRIAHEVLDPAAEAMSDLGAVVLSSVPALVFFTVSIVSKHARFVGIPYLLWYGVNFVQACQRIRIRELELDRMGLILMERAGYDIREVPRYWEEQITLGKRLLLGCVRLPSGRLGPVRSLPQ
jgi:hypothetical protein